MNIEQLFWRSFGEEQWVEVYWSLNVCRTHRVYIWKWESYPHPIAMQSTLQLRIFAMQTYLGLNGSREGLAHANEQALMGRLNRQDTKPTVEGITRDVQLLLSDGQSWSLAATLPHTSSNVLFLASARPKAPAQITTVVQALPCLGGTIGWDHRLHGDELVTHYL